MPKIPTPKKKPPVAHCPHCHQTLTRAQVGALLASLKTEPSGGRPIDETVDRCPCGANTLTRAKARSFNCCKQAGYELEDLPAK